MKATTQYYVTRWTKNEIGTSSAEILNTTPMIKSEAEAVFAAECDRARNIPGICLWLEYIGRDGYPKFADKFYSKSVAV